MFAIIETGGKQYRVEPGEVLRIEKLGAEEGEMFFERVHLATQNGSVLVGRPLVEGVRVRATVLVPEGKEKKILVFHKKRRKRFRKTRGHRQRYSEVRIEEILMPKES